MASVKDNIDLIKEIQKLNPDTTIELKSRFNDEKNEQYFYSSTPIDKLNLPNGYKVDAKYGITNMTSFNEGLSVKVEDINEVKEGPTHDISKILGTGYTQEEEDKLRREAEQKALEEELKKAGGFDAAMSKAKGGASGDTVTNDESKKIVKNNKSLYAKAEDLYNRIKDGLTYFFDKSKKVGKPTVETKSNTQGSGYNGQNLDDMIAVSNLLKKIKPDPYMKNLLEAKTGKSIEDELDADSHALVNVLKEITFLGEIHNFAVKDKAYSDAEFAFMAAAIVKLRQEELYKANKLLQQVRYAGVTEGQMAFLADRIKHIDEKFEFPGKKDTPNSGTNNGGSNNGGSQDTPEGVVLEEADKRKAEVQKMINEAKSNLYNGLGDYEKAFVDDAAAEGLEPGDSEFIQMMNERAIDKQAVLYYLHAVEELNKKYAAEVLKIESDANRKRLGEYEVMFLEDAKAEGLNPKDEEFRMMMGERTVNADQIKKYFSYNDKINGAYNQSIDNINKKEEAIKNMIIFYLHNFNEQNVIKPPLVDISEGDKNLEEIRQMREQVEGMVESSGGMSK